MVEQVSSLAIVQALFQSNQVRQGDSSEGGAITLSSSVLTLTDSTLTSNQGSFGGAISVTNSVVSISRIQASLNNASSEGGVIFCRGSALTSSSTVSIESSQLHDNQALSGGVLSVDNCQINVRNNLVSQNVARS